MLNYYKQGDQTKAYNSIQASLNELKSDPSCQNKLQILLSRIQIEMRNYKDAISLARKTLSYYQNIKRDPEQEAIVYNIIGAAHFHTDQLDSTQY